MFTQETRPLSPDEAAHARAQLDRMFPRPSLRTRWVQYLWWGTLALLPVAYAFTSGNLVTILVILLLEIAFVLFLVWFTGRSERDFEAAYQTLLTQIEGRPHRVTTVTDGETLEVEAYGMHLWVVQADFSTLVGIDSRAMPEAARWPQAHFQLIELDFEKPVDGGRILLTGLRLYRPMGERIPPIATLGPQEFERIRANLPLPGATGHGRISALLELIGHPPSRQQLS